MISLVFNFHLKKLVYIIRINKCRKNERFHFLLSIFFLFCLFACLNIEFIYLILKWKGFNTVIQVNFFFFSYCVVIGYLKCPLFSWGFDKSTGKINFLQFLIFKYFILFYLNMFPNNQNYTNLLFLKKFNDYFKK